MQFVRLVEITEIQDLSILKLAFNEEGITYRVLFEHTLTQGNLAALGSHGAIIEVAREDVDWSKEILLGLGIELDYDLRQDQFAIVNRVDQYAKQLPFVQDLRIEYRVLLGLTLPIIFILLIVFWYLAWV